MNEYELSGHEGAWQIWRAAMASSRMPHGWILAGPRGIGKSNFARAAAAELVAEPGVTQPMPANHPDILLLDHLPTDDSESAKRDDGKPFKLKRNITIDQIRAMQRKLHTRPTLGSRRMVIIDPADDMEPPAVNALLKSLEEPPQGTHFILIAHRLGRLLPTIRSRCRVLRFAALADADMASILAAAAPEADQAARTAAIVAAQGSPGAALSFIDEKLGRTHGLMLQIIRDGDGGMALRGMLSEAIGARPGRERQAAVLDLARAVIADNMAHNDAAKQTLVANAYAKLNQLAVQAPIYNFDPGLLAMEIGSILASVGLASVAMAKTHA